MRFTYAIVFSLLINLFIAPNMAGANDLKNAPEINWVAGESQVDFCPNSNTFDFRNAYWLAALSYFSYWHIRYADPIISSDPTQILDLSFELNNNDINNASLQKQEYRGLGFGKLVSGFFTSGPTLPESSQVYSNLYRKWKPSLPYEACVKSDHLLCFAGHAPMSTESSGRSQLEKDFCGEFNEKAYLEVSRIKRIQDLVLGNNLSPELAELAIKDKNYIEEVVRQYENKKGVSVNLDWSAEDTSRRCELFKYRANYMPDTQAGIFENENAITIVFRGTEKDNINDIRTDLMTFNQIELSKFSDGKGSLHRGFYQASIVLRDWLVKSLKEIRSQSPSASTKPIFITGHSLGGAIANIVTYSILKYNDSVNDPKLKINIKALYTFGAPRVGDQAWAEDLQQLAEKSEVGLYRLVNFTDLVPHVPCLNYTHAGALILMDASNLSKTTDIVKVLFNPIDKILNLGAGHINLANCGYQTALHYPMYVKEMIGNHFMTSYHESLSTLRRQLRTKLASAQQAALRRGDAQAAAQFSYPQSCQKAKKDNLDLEGVELNYQLLKNTLED